MNAFFKAFPVAILLIFTGSRCTIDNALTLELHSFEIIENSCMEGGESNLYVSEKGQVYLSWLEYYDDTTTVFMFSKFEKGKWGKRVEISRGTNWFVNWADFPSFVSYRDSETTYAAHWLQMSAEGTYDYDIRIAQSNDAGVSWNPSFILHKDGIAAEHGFVSMLPISENRIFAAWLDGRNTKGDSNNADEHNHRGAMTLRAGSFDINGNMFDEVELDNKVCDCCQTAAVKTGEGLVLAYRDRSEEEIRDISIVRQVDGKWTQPISVHEDNWRIDGCPVNGPAMDATDKLLAIAWFTMTDAVPKVLVSISEDAGANFSKPLRVDDGDPLGRVDIIFLDDETSLVSWLEQTHEGADIKIRKINLAGQTSKSITLAKTEAARQSGFPRMVRSNDTIFLSWTGVSSKSRVKTAWATIE